MGVGESKPRMVIPHQTQTGPSQKEAALAESADMLHTLERKHEYNSRKLNNLKREVSELGKVAQQTKSKQKMTELKAKMLQMKREEAALQQLQGQIDNMTVMKTQVESSALTAETVRVLQLLQGELQKTATDVADIDALMLDNEELLRQHRETGDAMAKPLDTGEMPMDEDDLWKEFNELNFAELDAGASPFDADADADADAAVDSDAQMLQELQALQVELHGLPSPSCDEAEVARTPIGSQPVQENHLLLACAPAAPTAALGVSASVKAERGAEWDALTSFSAEFDALTSFAGTATN